jgi:periplasmic protein TonB
VALVVPDRLSFLQSAEAGWLRPVRGGEALPAMLGLSIREPQKIVNVSPEYPRSAIEQRRTGTVVLECVIDVDGEVSHIRLLQSVHRSLDLAAFGSVSGWKYTPTLVGGKPVPVIMTVTVNFKIS